MIRYLVTRRHAYTMGAFLADWGRALAGRIEILPYERMRWRRRFPPGLYVFSDLERLVARAAAAAGRLADRLAGRGRAFRLLNHPRISLGREELLSRLHEDGTNSFRAFRAATQPADLRFPVFLHGARDHEGARTGLLQGPEDLAAALRAAGPDVLVVEFKETRGVDGLYRKYSAFRVGDRIVPRHLFFGERWCVKEQERHDPALLDEEWDYVQANPHEEELRRIFERARIGYGRVDYAVADGHLEVWEINTNPSIASPYLRERPERSRVHERAARLLIEAFRAAEPAGVAAAES